MPTESGTKGEVKLLDTLIANELKEIEDVELKQVIKKKAESLYNLLFIFQTQDLDEEGMRKSIKSLIEEG
jgi:hypothetical protein